MFEGGKIHKINDKWTAKYDKKYGIEDPIPLGYENVLFPYNFLALGIALAIPIILGEYVIKRKLPSIDVNSPRTLSDVINVDQLLRDQEKKIEHLETKNALLESRIMALMREKRTHIWM